ncbi:MAG: hypothetical protein AAGB93_04705 [Planctomycetota bacterium]
MRKHTALALGLVLTLAYARASTGDAVHGLPADHVAPPFDDMRSAAIATPAEVAWRDIPWRTNLADGIADAADADRPLLLWLMNGHPAGFC